MKQYFPHWYKKFSCIADKCPDSCCKEWDVVVDDLSYERYRKLDTPFGKKLNEVMVIDSDGDRIFTLQKGRCPFWNEDCLCDIYINLGEDALCETCKRFPRIVMGYADREEHILSFACPEAAKIMLEEKDIFSLESSDDGRAEEVCEYDSDFMEFLRTARDKILAIFSDKFCDLNTKMQKFSDFAEALSVELYGKSYICRNLEKEKALNILSELEIMTDEWRMLLANAKQAQICEADIKAFEDYAKPFEYEFENLAFYYIYRYFCNAVADEDITFCINSLLLAYQSIRTLECARYKQNGEISFQQRVRIFQLYSKEVEHSFENIEKLEDVFNSAI